MEIRKVLERKDGIKMVIIPKKSEIKKDDYVKINKMEDKNDRGKEGN
jgi:hypothetical protein